MPKLIGSIVTLWDNHNLQGKKPAPAIFCDQDQCRGFARLYSIAGAGSKWREYHFKCQKCGHSQKVTTGEKPPNCSICDCRPCVCEKKPAERLGIAGHDIHLTIDCPHCGAKKGAPCIGRVSVHSQRTGVAKALQAKHRRTMSKLDDLMDRITRSSPGFHAQIDEEHKTVDVTAPNGRPLGDFTSWTAFTEHRKRWLAGRELPTSDELDTFKHYGIEAPK